MVVNPKSLTVELAMVLQGQLVAARQVPQGITPPERTE